VQQAKEELAAAEAAVVEGMDWKMELAWVGDWMDALGRGPGSGVVMVADPNDPRIGNTTTTSAAATAEHHGGSEHHDHGEKDSGAAPGIPLHPELAAWGLAREMKRVSKSVSLKEFDASEVNHFFDRFFSSFLVYDSFGMFRVDVF
jgi:hypothetical protein